MNYKAHWQALYDAIRGALDDAGLNAVPLLAVTSTDTQIADTPAEPPYVVYTTETAQNTGTYGGGNAKVRKNGWRITARARDLGEILDIATAITAVFEDDDVADTTDGYVTTHTDILGEQTLWEVDSKLAALHMRIEWERSK